MQIRKATSALVSIVATVLTVPSVAFAYPEPLVVPSSRLQIGFGFGLGHTDPPSLTGMGFNVEAKYGLGGGAEFGIRTGIRNSDGRTTNADSYGRPSDWQTFGTGRDTFANPELRIRQAVTSALALEARAYVPFNGHFGFMLAAPMHLQGNGFQLDSGVYVPLIFTDGNTESCVSIPAQLWLATNSGSYIGLLSGARLANPGGNWSVPIGVGFDRTLSQAADLVLWFMFPDVTRDSAAKQFGGGVALRFRI
jgi:hypothetical protein